MKSLVSLKEETNSNCFILTLRSVNCSYLGAGLSLSSQVLSIAIFTGSHLNRLRMRIITIGTNINNRKVPDSLKAAFTMGKYNNHCTESDQIRTT
jgi:hypothetical protein